MRLAARIAVCPHHGLHGDRRECFDCARPVRRPLYVAAAPASLLGAVAIGGLLALLRCRPR